MKNQKIFISLLFSLCFLFAALNANSEENILQKKPSVKYKIKTPESPVRESREIKPEKTRKEISKKTVKKSRAEVKTQKKSEKVAKKKLP